MYSDHPSQALFLFWLRILIMAAFAPALLVEGIPTNYTSEFNGTVTVNTSFVTSKLTTVPLTTSGDIQTSTAEETQNADITQLVKHTTLPTKERNPLLQYAKDIPVSNNSEGLCYRYKRIECIGNSTNKGLPKELEPSCYPQIVPCPYRYCQNIFAMSDEYILGLDGWHGNMFESDCGDPKNKPEDQAGNVGQCKYATGTLYVAERHFNGHIPLEQPYDLNICICEGLLCNKYDNNTVMFFKRTRYVNTSAFVEPAATAGLIAEPCGNETIVVVEHRGWGKAFIGACVVNVVIIIVCCLAIRYCLCTSNEEKKASYSLESSGATSQDTGSSFGDEKLMDFDIDYSTLVPLTQGRFGKLFRLSDVEQKKRGVSIVVKVYDRADAQFWANEVKMYEYPGVSHKNVLRYFGSIQRQSSYLLLLEYHSKGSLRDYLRDNSVEWKDMITIMHTMLKGLAHLHSAAILSPNDKIKHPIGHRDIKSSNIMLDNRLQAKIGDFNLAQSLESRNLNKSDLQERVGTCRYMAPEILGGQINYTREAVLQADVYAMALVMWEVFSRCDVNGSSAGVQEYRLPFHEYVGNQPTTEKMHQVVCVDNNRPRFTENLTNPMIQEVVSTIRDSWEKDGEIRLTAACIEMRLQEFAEEQGHINTSYV